MRSIIHLRKELFELRNDVIGLFKHRTTGAFELVLEVDDARYVIDSVFISSFGAISPSYGMPTNSGTLILFPDGKNMNDMLDDPFEWDTFIKSFS